MNVSEPMNERSDGQRIIDSPWYWVCLFALAALMAMIAIGPKFQRRQERLQQQSQAREQVWRERVEGGQASGPSEAFDPIENFWEARLRLWPLMALALVVAGVAWGKLWLTRIRRMAVR
jgi:hypothetical protein